MDLIREKLKAAYAAQAEADGTTDMRTFKSILKGIGLNPDDPAVTDAINSIADGMTINGAKLPDFIAFLVEKQNSQKNMRKIFDMIDADKNGFLDRYEIKMAFAMLGEPYTPEQVEALMTEADTDNDGKISFEEFSTCKAAEVFTHGLG